MVAALILGAEERDCPYCRPKLKKARGFIKRRRASALSSSSDLKAKLALLGTSTLETETQIANTDSPPSGTTKEAAQ